MIRKILLYYLVFMKPLLCLGQESHDYIGGIVLNDTLTITYKISLVDKNGKVEGYSISDLGGKYETKSSVFGEYNEDTKELSFRETQTIYTKTPLEPNYDFCYINTTIKNFSLGKTKKVKTKFIGLFSDNTKCINGELFLSLAEKIEAKMERMAEKINKMKRIPDSVKQKFQPLKMMDTLNMNILRKDQTLSIFSKSKSISLIIYDAGKEDGDKISIYANNKPLLENYEAKKEQKIIRVKIGEGTTTLVIKATNEGVIAPNTVVVELQDEDNTIKALSNLKKGETTQIDILKRKNEL
ncbi:hypothetical protein [Aestuariivivens sp. NBU2969]|uniref:hypothetical protein n=1 Tax=Aestuariivivens sp. NBU2969 TaxID=2873267 RepID=UPI001CC1B40D|nr:hypothetical protein [Aestuariivivens sp. NBU2969]